MLLSNELIVRIGPYAKVLPKKHMDDGLLACKICNMHLDKKKDKIRRILNLCRLERLLFGAAV